MASSTNATHLPEKPHPAMALWEVMTRFDTSKIEPGLALRNAIGITIPLAIAMMVGNPTAGSLAATGALSVAFSDANDPYMRRAQRMLVASILVAAAVFIGALSARN